MIKLAIIGHLGKDANIANVNGATVINFNVAHTESFKNTAGEKVEKTIWVGCAWWTDKTAIVPFLKKGTQVYCEGQPDVNLYQTQDGRHGAEIKLRIGMVQLLGSADRNTTQAGAAPSASQGANNGGNTGAGFHQPPQVTVNASNELVDDLPF